MTRNDSIWRIVSSPTPTMMRSDVPPKKPAIAWSKRPCAISSEGMIAMRTRPTQPMKVTRVIVRSRNSAVGRPGRMPGM